MKMCFIYDMVEFFVGDIIFCDGVLKDEKSCCEVVIMDYLIDDFFKFVGVFGLVGKEIWVIWQEYEDG